MPIYKYAPYYQYNGPSKNDPMREELSREEIEQRLESISKDISSYFEDVDAKIHVDAQGAICITTDLAQKDCDERLKRCLNSLDLYARRIAQ
jgi:hypothetical protein